MPPDGYESVTLPVELVNELDHLKDEGESRADVVRRLTTDRKPTPTQS